MPSRRASRRYDKELAVSVHGPGMSLVGATVDVSRYGLLIRSQEERRAGELVQLWVQVSEGRWLQMLAIVARLVPDLPGYGARLHMMGGAEKVLWDELLDSLGDDHAPDRRERPDEGGAERSPVPRFLVRPRSAPLLERMSQREMSLGGMFVRTPIPRPEGSEVELLVIHPVTEHAFHVTGHVVLEHRTGPMHERGNGILFDEGAVAGGHGLAARFDAFCQREQEAAG